MEAVLIGTVATQVAGGVMQYQAGRAMADQHKADAERAEVAATVDSARAAEDLRALVGQQRAWFAGRGQDPYGMQAMALQTGDARRFQFDESVRRSNLIGTQRRLRSAASMSRQSGFMSMLGGFGQASGTYMAGRAQLNSQAAAAAGGGG